MHCIAMVYLSIVLVFPLINAATIAGFKHTVLPSSTRPDPQYIRVTKTKQNQTSAGN